MPTRRQFLQDVAVLAGAAGINSSLLESIHRAQAIEPETGSSYLDAEHVVILMQENRSFDHAFGTLRGVRGFQDPRAIKLPDGNPVFVQSNEKGERYIPFRLDLKESKTSWMSCLPHGWTDQTDATNGGKHDRWLPTKKSGVKQYAEMPLTMGYHTREDIPFYYALADAFTICDQHFCSTLTGTTPNRLHLWTGTSRTAQSSDSHAQVWNHHCDYGKWANWMTFPERLEQQGVSWKIYQNELTVPTGQSGEEDAWTSNFGCNPIEWFTQYNVRFNVRHRAYLTSRLKETTSEIFKISEKLAAESGETRPALEQKLEKLKIQQAYDQQQLLEFSAENFAKLTPYQLSLHQRAFSTNEGDPDFRKLVEITYQDGAQTRQLKIPEGDVLHQFRKDVTENTLPKVSWIVPPERFSDHPCSPWYGQWYLSEILNILTQKPEVWKKTIFILTYDENDGCYDHIPPFQAPHPHHPESGLASAGLDTTLDYVELEQDLKHNPPAKCRANSLGLGFRVPMIIASPWSRGGCVCSQVFDHTSVLQFLEKMLTHQTGKKLEETNITAWRRAICGDLTSAFQSTTDLKSGLTDFVERDTWIKDVYNARYKSLPTGFHALTDQQVEQILKNPADSLLPQQEPGTRPSCPLPYQLQADGKLDSTRTQMMLQFEAKTDKFQDKSAGAGFIVYAQTATGLTVRHYSVTPGSMVQDVWPLAMFTDGKYHFRIHGPNGFYRELSGSKNDPQVSINFDDAYDLQQFVKSSRHAGLVISNHDPLQTIKLKVEDSSYGHETIHAEIAAGEFRALPIDTIKQAGWYDLKITITEFPDFEKHYAGRIENGTWSISDPAIGRDHLKN
jgi:phospholipase C